MSDEYVRDHDPYMHLHELELPQYVYENLVQRRGDHVLNNYNYDNMSIANSIGDTSVFHNNMSSFNSQNQNGSNHTGSVYEEDFCDNSSHMMFERKHMHVVPTYQMNPEHCITYSASSISHNQSRKRKIMKFSNNDEKSKADFEMSVISGSGSGCDAGSSSNTMSSQASRKMNNSSYNGSAYDDDADSINNSSMLSERKQNHSQIEKRRRDKMNTYITELSALVPMCRAMARKLDKLTVLRLAVQHMRSVRGALSASPSATPPRPAFISERDMNSLVLKTAEDCFMFVVSCDRGRLLYVSSSVTKILEYNQNELIGQSVFDIIHPKDVSKVKEQLSSSDLGPRERFVDAKTMLPIKPEMLTDPSHLCPGARRSFFCRIKYKRPTYDENVIKEEVEALGELTKKTQVDRKYCILHCTGYLKYWSSSEMMEGNSEAEMPTEISSEDPDAENSSCLVAVGRAITLSKPETPTTSGNGSHSSFSSRNAIDGKFLYVEQRATLAIGYLPQEMVGTSLYEYVNEDELNTIAHSHRAALMRKTPILTGPYCFKRKDGTTVLMQTLFKPFNNPWTKDTECLVGTHTILNNSQESLSPGSQSCNTFQESDINTQILIDSHMESHKIGSVIAEEVMRKSPPTSSPDRLTPLTRDTGIFNYNASHTLPDEETYSQIRNNVALSSARVDSPNIEKSSNCNADHESLHSNSPTLAFIDGNGEAEMAVVMSLLEADAGFCPSVDLASLPWEGA